jgi:hypothetical protein
MIKLKRLLTEAWPKWTNLYANNAGAAFAAAIGDDDPDPAYNKPSWFVEAGLTFNFDSIADEKIAGPRRLSKNVKLRNLKKPDMQDFEQFGAKAIASVSMQYEQALLEYTETLLSRTEYDEDEELDEFSGAGAVAGYTIPLGAGPARKKDFYKKMAKPIGGSYMQDPAKIKPRP